MRPTVPSRRFSTMIRTRSDRSVPSRRFLENLHIIHRYPLSRSDPTWAWVLCADLLAALMMVWAVSGVIMWLRMPRVRALGTAFLAASVLVFGGLVFALFELGF